MEISIFTLVSFVIIVYLLYKLVRKNEHYFHDKPICYTLGKPYFGDTIDFFRKKYTFIEFFDRMYYTFPDAR
jgi:predicted nucleic acid-binding OB-fold protein